MKYLYGIVFILSFIFQLNAQYTEQKIKIYKAWISFMNDSVEIKGNLYEIKDSLLLLSRSFKTEDNLKKEMITDQIYATDIKIIKLRNEKNVYKGMLLGTLTGFAIGGFLGYTARNSFFDPPTSALLAGIPLGGFGLIIGAVVGAKKIKIPINGDLLNFNVHKYRLIEYSIVR